tara:strand:+ start:315 stop:959 length:645 start_codon:yes stop_codon:yes gene_type:complete
MFEKYNTFIFDCDGVILDSNSLKTQAFYDVVIKDGAQFANKLVQYHKDNGGISRYKKFEHYLKVINKKSAFTMDNLLENYKNSVVKGLLSCNLTKGFNKFIKDLKNSHCIIISGGDDLELNTVFKKRDLSVFFDGGIFGSPKNKDEIIKEQISKKNIVFPAIYFGDSKYDYEVSKKNEIDFIFIYELSEIKNATEWSMKRKIQCFKNFDEIYHE